MRSATFMALLGLAAAFALPAWAGLRPPPQDAHASHERQAQPAVPWHALDRDTRQILAPLKQRWDRLPAHAQHHLMEKAKRWERLPAYRQKRIRHNIQRWQQM
ncbi:MAG TPA: DUF3106 domain-containing protein, partial [Rhodanobacteraceae bacterium]|nr:DUF3106 domain-containing protein [Rhodanobacteraceae bacterium]